MAVVIRRCRQIEAPRPHSTRLSWTGPVVMVESPVGFHGPGKANASSWLAVGCKS